MSVLGLDFETGSECDLRRAGSYHYARHPSTFVICMAWAFDDEPVQVWRKGDPFPHRVYVHVRDGGTVRGWHVAFEHDIWNETLPRQLAFAGTAWPELKVDQLDCTMARAAYWSLPLALDQSAQALGSPYPKDEAGHRLMLQMTKPRRHRDGSISWWHDDDPIKFDRLCSYCGRDVEAERWMARNTYPLPPRERAVWLLDRKINLRGVAVDLPFARKLKAVTKQASHLLNIRMATLTNGEVTACSKATALLEWLRQRGWTGTDLKKQTVREALGGPLTPVVQQGLQLRREAARSSTAKLSVLETASWQDRLHGMLQYYGANRTGRWAGRLVQLQNLPRPTIEDVGAAVACVEADADANDLDLLFEDSPLGTVSSCLRSTIVAGPGQTLVSVDLAQIEARVIAWLAGQLDILEVFRSGEDVYVYTARRVNSGNRGLGKVLVLACGFGMGWPKFQATARGYKVFLTDDEALDNVAAWRLANPDIVRFWWACDDSARRIAGGYTGTIYVGPQRVAFTRRKNSMVITLPSGRELVYRGIALEEVEDEPSVITYWGISQLTKQWGRVRTYGGKIAENITQAVARDVLACGMLELDRLTVPLVLSVHDEAVAEIQLCFAGQLLRTMLGVMKAEPIWPGERKTWAPGLPVDAAGWIGPRYRKG